MNECLTTPQHKYVFKVYIYIYMVICVSDWQKTESQKRRERLLLEELVNVVNKRDELVQHLDTQERA